MLNRNKKNPKQKAQNQISKALEGGQITQEGADALNKAYSSGAKVGDFNLNKLINKKGDFETAISNANRLNNAVDRGLLDTETVTEDEGTTVRRNENLYDLDNVGVKTTDKYGTPGSQVTDEAGQANEAVSDLDNYISNYTETINNSIANAYDPQPMQDFLNRNQAETERQLAALQASFDLGYDDNMPGFYGEQYREGGNTILEQQQAAGVLDSSLTTGQLAELDRQMRNDFAQREQQVLDNSYDRFLAERGALRDVSGDFTQLFAPLQQDLMKTQIQADLEQQGIDLQTAQLLAELIMFDVVNQNNLRQQEYNNAMNEKAYKQQQRALLQQQAASGEGGINYGGAAFGALGGAATGAKIGSIVPGLGTAIGAGIGGVVGAFGGANS